MSNPHDTDPDGPLSPEAEARVRLLTPADLQRIDEHLLSLVSDRWQKVARIVAMAMGDLDGQIPALPDIFFGLRIKRLAESGAIEAAGDLSRMRNSEVRILGLKTR